MTESHHDLGGTVRARTPQKTLEVIKPYIQKAGITRIANLTYLDCIGIPVYTCFRPTSRNLSTSQGKGITDDLAKCSAYMEAIEHYYSEQLTPTLTHRLTSQDPSFIVPTELPRGMLRYPRPTQKIQHWSTSHSLLSGQEYHVPTYYLNFDLSHAYIEDGMFRKSTTGLASGNTKTEALCHSLYEIIERHCMQRFEKASHATKLKRMIDVATIDNPYAQALLERLHAQHIDLVIFELDSPFNIPAYHCIIADENPFRKLGHYSGSGSHLNKGIALCRAITEAIQSRLTYIAGSRDDMFPKDYNMMWQPLKFTGKRDYRTLGDAPTLSLDQQYQHLLTHIERLKYDALMIEHTTAQDSICVVHTLIPGLAV
jgi:YcaO-like protein with predicted kinase domain